MFQDYLLYATDVEVRYAFRMLHLSHLASNAAKMHELNKPRSVLLANALLGGVLLASILQDEERINLRVQCGGDFTIGTETTLHAETRGYIECTEGSPLVALLDQNLPLESMLQVRTLRSKSSSSGVFEGMSQTFTNSIEEALNQHLEASYQMNAQLKMESWFDPKTQVLHSLGIIFMELPNLDSHVQTQLWKHVAGLPSLQELYSRSDDPDDLGAAMIPDRVRPVNSINPKWSCTCSQQSIENMLLRLQREELVSMVHDKEPIDVRCHYCNKSYHVSLARLGEILVSTSDVSDTSNGPLKN